MDKNVILIEPYDEEEYFKNWNATGEEFITYDEEIDGPIENMSTDQ